MILFVIIIAFALLFYFQSKTFDRTRMKYRRSSRDKYKQSPKDDEEAKEESKNDS